MAGRRADTRRAAPAGDVVPKDRYRREGDTLDRADMVVIRGGALGPELLYADALRNHSVYGVYGISVFAFAMPQSTSSRSNRRWCASNSSRSSPLVRS